MTKLQINLTKILQEKNEKIIPENIREDITIFGVTGTVKEGTLDTSDATAVSDDIMKDKIAYANGEILVGTIKDNGLLDIVPNNERQIIDGGYTSGGTVKAVNITTLREYQTCLTKSKIIQSTNQDMLIELEYIESDGNESIDTGIAGNTVYGVEFEWTPTKLSNTYQAYLCGRLDNFTLAAYQNLTNSYFRHRGKAISTSIITLSDDINILKILDNKVTINNEDYSTIQNQPISTYSDNVFIFSAPNNNRPSSMRFYGLKLFGEIGDLLGNFVPVKKMNGQVGVYDKISKTIITSSSGNFITGPEINIIEEE